MKAWQLGRLDDFIKGHVADPESDDDTISTIRESVILDDQSVHVLLEFFARGGLGTIPVPLGPHQ